MARSTACITADSALNTGSTVELGGGVDSTGVEVVELVEVVGRDVEVDEIASLVDVRDVVSDVSALTLAAVEVVLVLASSPELQAAA